MAVGLLEHVVAPNDEGRAALAHTLGLLRSIDYTLGLHAGDGACYESAKADQEAHEKLLAQLVRTEQDGGGWQGVGRPGREDDFEPQDEFKYLTDVRIVSRFSA